MSSSRQPPAGHANNSSWNDSGFAFSPNTNVLDRESMPSDQAQAAREKAAQVMAALKSGDTERANALMGKDETQGRLLPGMGWIKRKLNARGEQSKVHGVEVGEESQGGSGKGEAKGEVVKGKV